MSSIHYDLQALDMKVGLIEAKLKLHEWFHSQTRFRVSVYTDGGWLLWDTNSGFDCEAGLIIEPKTIPDAMQPGSICWVSPLKAIMGAVKIQDAEEAAERLNSGRGEDVEEEDRNSGGSGGTVFTFDYSFPDPEFGSITPPEFNTTNPPEEPPNQEVNDLHTTSTKEDT